MFRIIAVFLALIFPFFRADCDTKRKLAGPPAGTRIFQTQWLRHSYETLCRMVDDHLTHIRQQLRHESLYGAPPSEAPVRIHRGGGSVTLPNIARNKSSGTLASRRGDDFATR